MTAQNLILTSFPQKNFNRLETSSLQKGAEIATVIFMVAAFLVWFITLGA
jgi:hypothetical protein